jgi:hypothetical protein
MLPPCACLPLEVEHALHACMICDCPFVNHELVILYEEAEVPLFVFCRACALRVSWPPSGNVHVTTYSEG